MDAAQRTPPECPSSVRNSASFDGSKNGMKRKSPRDPVATALASQIDCVTLLGALLDALPDASPFKPSTERSMTSLVFADFFASGRFKSNNCPSCVQSRSP